MERIKKIDKKLIDVVNEIKKIAHQINFEEICEFQMSDNLNKSIPWDKINGNGLYFFELKNRTEHTNFNDWLEYFKPKWEDPIYKGKCVPNFNKKHSKEHSEAKEWIPFYIGKRSDLLDRIKSHLYYPLERNTYAMKLLARKNMKNEIFRLSIIKLDVENYGVITPILEKELRKIKNPVVGR